MNNYKLITKCITFFIIGNTFLFILFLIFNNIINPGIFILLNTILAFILIIYKKLLRVKNYLNIGSIFNGYFNLFKNKLNLLNKEKKELYNKRLNICLNCEFLLKESNTCEICGCFIKIKTKSNKAKCPKNFW